MTDWPFDPTVYAGLIVLAAGYVWVARAGRDLRSRRWVWFAVGLLTLWVALETPIDTVSDRYLDSVHMLQHVLLGFVAPPLMLLGLSPRMAGRMARIPGVRAATEPIAAQVIAAVVMVVWHVPPLYDATLNNEWLHVLEHVTFVAGGLCLYWPIIEITSSHSRWHMSPGAKLVYMLIATLPQDGVALPLIFSRVAFYDFYTHAPRVIDGFTAAIDQTIAGAVLMVFGKVTLAIAALVVFFRWFGEDHRSELTPVRRAGV